MLLPRDGYLLRIFIGERDKHGHLPLYQWIIQQAREQKLAGATAFRGIEGFGAHSHLHTTKILRLADDLPILIEIVDTKDKIESFLPIIDEAIPDGLATLEKVEIRLYRSGPPPGDPPPDEPAA